jgi:hypothetical protein
MPVWRLLLRLPWCEHVDRLERAGLLRLSRSLNWSTDAPRVARGPPFDGELKHQSEYVVGHQRCLRADPGSS